MAPEERQEVIRQLEAGEELSPEWARVLFPPEKREYELVYHSKEREEDILAGTLAVPLQAVRTFGTNSGGEWHNMLIFGDNLQVMKSLLEMKKAGNLCNADGTSGVRVLYIDPHSPQSASSAAQKTRRPTKIRLPARSSWNS
jgi:site-specific DNA-methyltransferase (adenine-specific)/adenine-specific DNA-methyltransferase